MLYFMSLVFCEVLTPTEYSLLPERYRGSTRMTDYHLSLNTSHKTSQRLVQRTTKPTHYQAPSLLPLTSIRFPNTSHCACETYT